MKRIGGSFISTGVDLYICCGFIPHWVQIWNIEDGGALNTTIYWNCLMEAITLCSGGIYICDTVARDAVTFGNGISAFDPTEANVDAPLAAASTVYFRLYNEDCKGATVRKWVLNTSANMTGHFANSAGTAASLPGTYITTGHSGSLVKIRETGTGVIKTARIRAMTALGSANDSVTLTKVVQNGDVLFVSSDVSFRGLQVGEVPKKGFKVEASTLGLNDAASEMHIFEAGTFEFTAP